MSAGKRFGIKGRLRSHVRSKRKGDEWTHFSVFQVWDNVTDQEIAEARAILVENAKGVGVVNGHMVDEAIARKARRVLAIAGLKD